MVLRFAEVSFRYPGAARDALCGATLAVEPGELVLVAGGSGAGKSTLLRAVNGIVPHLTGGAWRGDVLVAQRNTRTHAPRALADVVGFVHQDPEAQLVADHVERDIAFGMENLGYDAVTMRRRVEEVLDALSIAHLRDRDPATLSGGERQRVAIAGALSVARDLLVLDEPTSQLDPQGADDVIHALARLNSELGITTVVSEHRLDRVAPLADRVVLVREARITRDGRPGDALAQYDGAPTAMRVGEIAGWDPLPLTVKEARRSLAREGRALPAVLPPPLPAPGDMLVEAQGIDVDLDRQPVLHGATLTVRAGEVVAVLGRNGAGKTTLLRALAGLLDPARGRVVRHDRVAYVPQDPNVLISADTVRAELEATLALTGPRRRGTRFAPGRAEGDRIDEWLTRSGLVALAARDPRSLSGGERQRLAIAAVGVSGAPVLLLDEPTRGMDAASRDALAAIVDDHVARGGAVVVATHDTELVARVATRAVVLAEGEVVADGDPRAVLAGSLFAPPVLRIAPPLLTVDEFAKAWFA